tara:strand:- start:711 stop:827 length:117 start_codon:yes stop_codon:yes gene_type:complete
MFTPKLKVLINIYKILRDENKERINKKSIEILFLIYFA